MVYKMGLTIRDVPYEVPIPVAHLFHELDRKLIELLRSLTPLEWKKQTLARQWTVKDVVAHLLDTNIRVLSGLRDGYRLESPLIHNNEDLINYLNGLNADWVKAMKRASPEILIFLHEATGPPTSDYYVSMNPYETAPFAVSWAGEKESKNWFHLAREYTEKWHHQQQIREATARAGIMERKFFYPFIDTYMWALPYTYRHVQAPEGTVIKVTIPGEAGGSWYLDRSADAWILGKSSMELPEAEVIILPEISWRLFSKNIRANEIKEGISLLGNKELGRPALDMVSVMA